MGEVPAVDQFLEVVRQGLVVVQFGEGQGPVLVYPQCHANRDGLAYMGTT